MTLWWHLRDILASARAQPVGSGLIVVVAALSTFVPIVTAGQTDALERSLVTGLESRANRTLVLSARDGGALPPEALAAVGSLSLVDRFYGLGAAYDYHNAALTTGDGTRSGEPVAVFPLFGALDDLATVEVGRAPSEGEAVLTSAALARVGMGYPAGGLVMNSTLLRVRDAPRRDTPVVGAITLHDGVELGEAVALRSATEDELLTRLVVVATTFRAVPTLERLLPQVSLADPAALQVESSSELEAALGLLTGQVGRFGRELTLASIVVGSVFLALIVFGTLQGRRRDLGRRRALGASRQSLIAQAVLQTLIAAVPGALAGVVAGAVMVHRTTGLSPSPAFMAAVAVLGALASIVAAFAPAAVAAWGDPVAALRVP